ncbi:hypothetical protein N7510_000630 [Penicillium lagena]|uniref:uncharacterized protein n=1 Tax=Penicillium lagena TaxID=94218 RepID=UPI0025406380|nr:uncharacterized protein N7510_000630 [Penicillium lagena]KAJ5624321.1 hypothetical protein N7510_000630 [Penicillium lagena]
MSQPRPLSPVQPPPRPKQLINTLALLSSPPAAASTTIIVVRRVLAVARPMVVRSDKGGAPDGHDLLDFRQDDNADERDAWGILAV